jgi:hypothetical protein
MLGVRVALIEILGVIEVVRVGVIDGVAGGDPAIGDVDGVIDGVLVGVIVGVLVGLIEMLGVIEAVRVGVIDGVLDKLIV